MDYRDRARLGLLGPVAIRFPSIINPQSGDRAREEIALAIGNSRIGLDSLGYFLSSPVPNLRVNYT